MVNSLNGAFISFVSGCLLVLLHVLLQSVTTAAYLDAKLSGHN
jgi:hypothetical protein